MTFKTIYWSWKGGKPRMWFKKRKKRKEKEMRYLTCREFAAHVGLSEAGVRLLIRKGVIFARHIGPVWAIALREASRERFLNRRRPGRPKGAKTRNRRKEAGR